jgi:hypothetical protein
MTPADSLFFVALVATVFLLLLSLIAIAWNRYGPRVTAWCQARAPRVVRSCERFGQRVADAAFPVPALAGGAFAHASLFDGESPFGTPARPPASVRPFQARGDIPGTPSSAAIESPKDHPPSRHANASPQQSSSTGASAAAVTDAPAPSRVSADPVLSQLIDEHARFLYRACVRYVDRRSVDPPPEAFDGLPEGRQRYFRDLAELRLVELNPSLRNGAALAARRITPNFDLGQAMYDATLIANGLPKP